MTTSPKTGAHPQTAAHLPPHQRIAEPLLIFGSGFEPPTHLHPLLGLLRHGPYAQPPGLAAVRVATITAHGQGPRLFDFLRGLSREHQPTDRKAYVPAYPGFETLFGVPLLPSDSAHVELPEGAAGTGTDGHERLAEALGRAMLDLHAARDRWDVVVFLLPSAWERFRESPDGKFNLHDRLKAVAAPLGCPVQMLREDSALAYAHHCSLAWRLSIAMFAKAGGVPWRIAAVTQDDTAYVGLAYAIRGGTADEFVTCCSQVFDSEGGGMEFVAYNIGANRDLENPHLTREEMRAVMSRSAQLYQHRHAGRMPSRLVVHKTTRWRDEEVDGVLDAWSAAADIECLTVSKTPWRGVLLDQGHDGTPSEPHRGPVARGTFQQLSGRSGLLWVSGNALEMSVRGSPYNPSVKGLPRPALLTRDAGSGSLELAAKEVLALSKLDWNNDAPFDLVPVTIGYSQRLARVISHVPHLPDNVYQYRLFM